MLFFFVGMMTTSTSEQAKKNYGESTPLFDGYRYYEFCLLKFRSDCAVYFKILDFLSIILFFACLYLIFFCENFSNDVYTEGISN